MIQNILNKESGISPVIGVILMVAITVILSAVIGVFVLGVAENPSSTGYAAFDTDSTDDPYERTVRLTDLGNSDSVVVEDKNGETELGVGDSTTAKGEYTIYSVKDGNRSVLQSGGVPTPSSPTATLDDYASVNSTVNSTTTINTTSEFKEYRYSDGGATISGDQVQITNPSGSTSQTYPIVVEQPQTGDLYKVSYDVSTLDNLNYGYTYIYDKQLSYSDYLFVDSTGTDQIASGPNVYTGYYEPADSTELFQHSATDAVDTSQDATYTIDAIKFVEYRYADVLNYTSSTDFNNGSTTNGTINNDSVELSAGDEYTTEAFNKNNERYIVTVEGSNLDVLDDSRDDITFVNQDGTTAYSSGFQTQTSNKIVMERSILKSESTLELDIVNGSSEAVTIDSITVEQVEPV